MNTLEGIIEDVEKSDLVSKKVINKVIELIGQERWQELNDEEGDTITTTGELWITLKGIPDLEKENKVLAQNLEDTEILNKTYEKRFSDLKKENAELKETLRTYNGCGDWDNDFHTCRVYLQHEELQMYIEQLTKAKKIISEYMNILKGDTKNWKKAQEKAEQFLKSSEVKK